MDKQAKGLNIIVEVQGDMVANKDTGVLLPGAAKKSLSEGKVISIGEDVRSFDRNDVVFFKFDVGVQYEEDNNVYRIIKSEDILACSS